MKLANEQIKEILDCAPNGATHVNGDSDTFDVFAFIDLPQLKWWHVGYSEWWPWGGAIDGVFHSLSDLREIYELRLQIEQICNEEDDGVNDV